MRLLRNLTSWRVGLRGRLLLRSGCLLLPCCNHNRSSRSRQQTLHKFPAFLPPEGQPQIENAAFDFVAKASSLAGQLNPIVISSVGTTVKAIKIYRFRPTADTPRTTYRFPTPSQTKPAHCADSSALLRKEFHQIQNQNCYKNSRTR